MSINKACLVLNASYEPVSISSARRAITLMVKGAAVIEESYGREVYPGMALPAVVRLRNHVYIPHRMTVLTRKNIYARDHNMCMYCGIKVDPRHATLDHIIPESRGGKYSWENLVMCCISCNRKKADQTPEEAGMKLIHRPRPANVHTSRCLMRLIGLAEDKCWEKYLFS